jgi:hypothetical protein
MISTVTTFAPAGVLGQGNADARPYAGTAVRLLTVAPNAAVQGTGVPTARLRDVIVGVTCSPRGEFTAQFHAQKQSDQFDGTTLGFHPSSRPQS